MIDRRKFIRNAGIAGIGLGAIPSSNLHSFLKDELWFKISLAEWSYNKEIKSGEMTNLDFPGNCERKVGLRCR